MQIKFNSMKKETKFDLASSSLIRALIIIIIIIIAAFVSRPFLAGSRSGVGSGLGLELEVGLGLRPWVDSIIGGDFYHEQFVAILNPFATGNPFLGTKLLGFSIGRGSGALD